MGLLSTILNLFLSEALDIWSKVSGAFVTIVNMIPDDEVIILHAAMDAASKKMADGGGFEEAFTEALNTIVTLDRGELSKVGTLMLQAFIHATAPSQ